MSLNQLNSLYREVVLDHSQNPHHKHVLNGVTNKITLKNPTCGDVINLELNLEGNIIKDIGFTGEGCTISQASASMMTDVVIGKSISKSLDLAKIFSDMIIGKKYSQQELSELGDAAILSSIMQFPARIKCATLCWWALKKALGDENDDRLE